MIEHCLVTAGFPENVKIGKGFDVSKGKVAVNLFGCNICSKHLIFCKFLTLCLPHVSQHFQLYHMMMNAFMISNDKALYQP